MAYNTGNPLGSTDARDLADNAYNFDTAVNSPDGTWVDRLGVTRSTFEGAIAGLTFFNVGDFATGYTLTNSRQTLTYSGHEYGWDGLFPKVVVAGSSPTPLGSGGWIDRSDVTLRSELAEETSSVLIAGQEAKNVAYDPYVITGRVNIRNPKWGAPVANAEDAGAAAANATAINLMLASGARRVELDDKARFINSTLLISSPVTIHGPGRQSNSLIWSGGDAPIIARANYADLDSAGVNGVTLKDIRIADTVASRVNTWSIDLTNANSCTLDGVHLDGQVGSASSNIYGVALGKARGGAYAGTTFLSKVINSRLSQATLLINGSDWYITDSELWGNSRLDAIRISAGGTICGGTQIVPGANSGLLLFSDIGFDIDTLKIIECYFDGSSPSIATGWGIKSDGTTGLVSAEIVGNDFWHINAGAMNLKKAYMSTIRNNIRDCDSDDTGDADILIEDMYGCDIFNRHFRDANAPKTEAPRVNIGKPFVVSAKVGFPNSDIGGQVGFTSSYTTGTVTNPDYVRYTGGSNLTQSQRSTLPVAASSAGNLINYTGKPYWSNGTKWNTLSQDAREISVATNFNLFIDSETLYISSIAAHSNFPAGFAGTGLLRVNYVTTNYTVQQLTELASGEIATRYLDNGVWTAWVINV